MHLLWALPLAGAIALAVSLAAGIAACGVSGCSGGGFGPVTDVQPLAVILVLVAGAVLAAPLLLLSWTADRRARVGVAAVVGFGWAVWAWLSITGVL